MIPKIIHYCWFGGNSLPDDANKCIASWTKYFPDYEKKNGTNLISISIAVIMLKRHIRQKNGLLSVITHAFGFYIITVVFTLIQM
jgi:hypothetical protein